MAFSAAAFAASHRPWVFQDASGREHVARELSGYEAQQWMRQFEIAGDSPYRQTHTISRLIRCLFPLRLGMFRHGDPWWAIRRMSLPAQLALVQDFFAHAGLRMSFGPPTPMIRSSASSDSKPIRTVAANGA